MSISELLSALTLPLGFGTWQAYDYSNCDTKTFERVLFEALDQGIEFFDTAEAYGTGESEKLLGRALSSRRQDIFLTTKFSHHHSRPDLVEKSLMKSMRRLGTDYIDIYLQHWPPANGPRVETIEKLIELKKAGAVRAIGVCNWTTSDFESVSDLAAELDCIQLGFNFLWRHELSSVQELIKEYDLAVFAYSPLAQGLLAKTEATEAFYDARDKLVFSAESLAKVRTYFEELAKRYQLSVAAIALAWVRQQESISLPIFGATKLGQIREHIHALNKEIDFADEPVLDDDFTEFKSMWNWRPE